jgi:flagellin-like protein
MMLGLHRAESNKALSNVVASIILIVITILAVIIVWFFTKNIISKSPPELGCFDLSSGMGIEKACYLNNEEIKVDVKRGFDGIQIENLRFSFLGASLNSSVWEITGKKCLDIRLGERYGNYCYIVPEGAVYSYVFNVIGVENENSVKLGAGIEDGFCNLGERFVAVSC